jgi:hypothetical protein
VKFPPARTTAGADHGLTFFAYFFDPTAFAALAVAEQDRLEDLNNARRRAVAEQKGRKIADDMLPGAGPRRRAEHKRYLAHARRMGWRAVLGAFPQEQGVSAPIAAPGSLYPELADSRVYSAFGLPPASWSIGATCAFTLRLQPHPFGNMLRPFQYGRVPPGADRPDLKFQSPKSDSNIAIRASATWYSARRPIEASRNKATLPAKS